MDVIPHAYHATRHDEYHWVRRTITFYLHFTPTSASSINLVERFLRDFSQDVILPGSFASVCDLVDAIWKYLTKRNLKPQRYHWKAEGKAILEKIARTKEALARSPQIHKDSSETVH